MRLALPSPSSSRPERRDELRPRSSPGSPASRGTRSTAALCNKTVNCVAAVGRCALPSLHVHSQGNALGRHRLGVARPGRSGAARRRWAWTWPAAARSSARSRSAPTRTPPASTVASTSRVGDGCAIVAPARATVSFAGTVPTHGLHGDDPDARRLHRLAHPPRSTRASQGRRGRRGRADRTIRPERRGRVRRVPTSISASASATARRYVDPLGLLPPRGARRRLAGPAPPPAPTPPPASAPQPPAAEPARDAPAAPDADDVRSRATADDVDATRRRCVDVREPARPRCRRRSRDRRRMTPARRRPELADGERAGASRRFDDGRAWRTLEPRVSSALVAAERAASEARAAHRAASARLERRWPPRQSARTPTLRCAHAEHEQRRCIGRVRQQRHRRRRVGAAAGPTSDGRGSAGPEPAAAGAARRLRRRCGAAVSWRSLGGAASAALPQVARRRLRIIDRP